LKNKVKQESGFQWTKFAGLASQWAIALVILIFIGKFLDKKNYFKITTPLFIWLLPFIFILFSLINVVKATNNKNN
jgi:p-aminobenzoyl-glutamate transporter AbgT